MSHACRGCRAGLDHCHGTLIRHAMHRSECTDAECHDPDVVAHAFVIDCDAVDCGCTDAVGSAV